jgi:dephospho-CoA kinase
LLETCLQAAFDRVWVVTCGPEVQLQRLVLRLGEESLAKQLLATQLPSAVRRAFADEIIRTNSNEDDVKRCIRQAVQREIGK